MKRSKRLQVVVELATKEKDAILEQVGRANQAWLKEKRQLESLYQYREEYLAQLRSGHTQNMTAQRVLALRGFLSQLDQAIQAQSQQVAQQFKLLEQQRQKWKQAWTKEKSVQHLVERYQDEEQRLENKKEQRTQDEFSAQLWRRKQY